MLPIPNGSPKKVALTFSALITPKHPEQVIEMYINGVLQRKLVLNSSRIYITEIDLPDVLDDQKPLQIEFRTPNAVSPIDAGISTTDKRVLGIGLRTVLFQ